MSGKRCPVCSRFTLFKTSDYGEDRKCTSCGFWNGRLYRGTPRDEVIEAQVQKQFSDRLSGVSVPSGGFPKNSTEAYVEKQVAERLSRIDSYDRVNKPDAVRGSAHPTEGVQIVFKTSSLKAYALANFFRRISLDEVRRSTKSNIEAQLVIEAMNDVSEAMRNAR